MYAFFTLVRYRKRYIYFALTAMALHRIPLILSRKIKFHKAFGCGQGDTFSKIADWQQYGLLAVVDSSEGESALSLTAENLRKKIYGSFINAWWKFFGCEIYTIALKPLEGRGLWDGKKAFGELPAKSDYEGMIGILTRATIRVSKRKRFWKHVEGASHDMHKAEGYLFSVGIGENPFLRQATFSVWESKAKMKQFAYNMHHHVDAIQKAHKENWFKEDMFVRFKILRTEGTLYGHKPF
jgi:hypothetical protein